MFQAMKLLICVYGISAAGAVAQPQVQAFPAKPIRLVVPVPPGGSNDILSQMHA